MGLAKAWTAIDRLSIISKSELSDRIKRSFLQAAVGLILLYGCTTWTLTKRIEKKLDENWTRMLRVILNKSWMQHPPQKKQQLYGHLPPISKTIQISRTRHAGYCWKSKDELISDVLLCASIGRQQESTTALYRIKDAVLKTCRKWWKIATNGDRVTTRHDIYIYAED